MKSFIVLASLIVSSSALAEQMSLRANCVDRSNAENQIRQTIQSADFSQIQVKDYRLWPFVEQGDKIVRITKDSQIVNEINLGPSASSSTHFDLQMDSGEVATCIIHAEKAE